MKGSSTLARRGFQKLPNGIQDPRSSGLYYKNTPLLKSTNPSCGFRGSSGFSVFALSTPQESELSSNEEVTLRVWDTSELAVSIYPRFQYNAIGAGGPGVIVKEEGTRKTVRFNSAELQIPDLDSQSARVLGIPIPPPLRIKITTKILEGTVDTSTGETKLNFVAEFLFSIGALYKAPPLSIATILTTGDSTGLSLNATGSPLVNGRGKLVGVARVPRTGDWFLDGFLMLPTDALAQLAVEITFL